MPLIDVTLTLGNGMLLFPGDPPFQIRSIASRDHGDPYNLSALNLCAHTGTHVDAPIHYVDGGCSVDRIPLDYFIGNGIILDMRGKRKINSSDIQGSRYTDQSRVLFKTDNSLKVRSGVFSDDFCHLTPGAASFLVENRVKLIGIDYLSIDGPEDSDALAHKTILNSGAIIVEGLDLLEAPVGPCKIYCLPLKILDGDGAPARVVIEV